MGEQGLIVVSTGTNNSSALPDANRSRSQTSFAGTTVTHRHFFHAVSRGSSSSIEGDEYFGER
jgi:hypothetical protein